jgi:hypothetical protein
MEKRIEVFREKKKTEVSSKIARFKKEKKGGKKTYGSYFMTSPKSNNKNKNNNDNNTRNLDKKNNYLRLQQNTKNLKFQHEKEDNAHK